MTAAARGRVGFAYLVLPTASPVSVCWDASVLQLRSETLCHTGLRMPPRVCKLKRPATRRRGGEREHQRRRIWRRRGGEGGRTETRDRQATAEPLPHLHSKHEADTAEPHAPRSRVPVPHPDPHTEAAEHRTPRLLHESAGQRAIFRDGGQEKGSGTPAAKATLPLTHRRARIRSDLAQSDSGRSGLSLSVEAQEEKDEQKGALPNPMAHAHDSSDSIPKANARIA